MSAPQALPKIGAKKRKIVSRKEPGASLAVAVQGWRGGRVAAASALHLNHSAEECLELPKLNLAATVLVNLLNHGLNVYGEAKVCLDELHQHVLVDEGLLVLGVPAAGHKGLLCVCVCVG